MDQIIENLKPSNIQIEQSSIATSNSLSIIESVNGADVDNPAQEEERVADAFSVLSRYFDTLSSQLQVAIAVRHVRCFFLIRIWIVHTTYSEKKLGELSIDI